MYIYIYTYIYIHIYVYIYMYIHIYIYIYIYIQIHKYIYSKSYEIAGLQSKLSNESSWWHIFRILFPLLLIFVLSLIGRYGVPLYPDSYLYNCIAESNSHLSDTDDTSSLLLFIVIYICSASLLMLSFTLWSSNLYIYEYIRIYIYICIHVYTDKYIYTYIYTYI